MTLPRLRSFGLLLLLLFLVAACQSEIPLVSSIDERQANEIVVFLASKGITAQKQPVPTGGAAGGGDAEAMWNIMVSERDSADAMALLSRNGLPRRQGKTLINLFGNPGLVPTDTQQKILFQAGLADQIANMIRQIDGVIDANVQLSIPAPDVNQPITASVYVKHQGVLDNPNTQLVLKIRQLVAASVSGLALDNVTVVSDRSRFTDISLTPTLTSVPEQVRDYVHVWGVTVAKESVPTFQVLFFSLFFLLFLLLVAMGWIFWKTRPLMERAGGVALLWKKEPFLTEETPKEDSKEVLVSKEGIPTTKPQPPKPTAPEKKPPEKKEETPPPGPKPQ